jgi:hypothetical protein
VKEILELLAEKDMLEPILLVSFVLIILAIFAAFFIVLEMVKVAC